MMAPELSKIILMSAPIRALLALLVSFSAPCAVAQDDNFTPYVLSADEVVHRMLRMADVGPRDFLVDLGSGDGRIPIAAAKFYGARSHGVDLDPPLIALARANAAREGVSELASFELQDLFETDLSAASVVAFYLLPDVAMQLRPKLLRDLKPGTRIVAHDYGLGDWLPDEWTAIRVPDKPVAPVGISQVFLWVVPADARGRWTGQIDGQHLEIQVDQRFQMLTVRVFLAGERLEVRGARLRGLDVSIIVTGRLGRRDGVHRMTGRISGDRIDGEIITGTRAPERVAWEAARQ